MSEASSVPVDSQISPLGESPEPGEVSSEEISPFQQRVDTLVQMVAEDPIVRDRMLAEVYVTLAEFSEQFRAMSEQFGSLGPKAFFKMMRGGE